MRLYFAAIQAALAAAMAGLALQAHAVEWSGLVDVRAVAADSDRSWTREGLGKLRYDGANDGIRLGQAMLRGEGELADTVSGVVVVSASDDRRGLLDLNEAWLRWSPVPGGPWKTRVKAGIFFPPMSLENDGLGWTPTRTVSSSAVNSWIGEELRTEGVELSLSRRGRAQGSPHDIGLVAALFEGNDPTGTLLTWRGWGIGDRITGVRESILLADLPVYQPSGGIPKQDRSIHVFREIDGRLGYYLGARYGYADRFELAAMHYDNRGDPMRVEHGQYSWQTRFNHVSARLQAGDWEYLFQAIDGMTMMGPHAAYADYRAWYALASHALGPGKLSLRYDKFMAREEDIIPSDPNSEDGRGLALAYTYRLDKSWELVAEALLVQSDRPSRALLGIAPRQNERSLTAAIRWQF